MTTFRINVGTGDDINERTARREVNYRGQLITEHTLIVLYYQRVPYILVCKMIGRMRRSGNTDSLSMLWVGLVGCTTVRRKKDGSLISTLRSKLLLA